MTAIAVAAIAVVVLVALAALVVFNSLVRLRNSVTNGWALVDAELQRRHDLVPNLVETVRGYAEHERTVLEAATAARAAALQAPATVAGRDASEPALVESMRGVLAVAERYPELRASEQFLALQRRLADTEDRIAVARRVYNANVRDYNTAIQSFPGLLFANDRAFTTAAPFSVDDALRVAGPPSTDDVTP